MRKLSEKDTLILKAIGREPPNTLTPSEAAKRLNLSPQNFNRYLNKLEGKGSLKREKASILTFLSLTPKGAREVEESFTRTVYPPARETPRRLHAYGLSYPLLATRKPGLPPSLYHEQISAAVNITQLNHNRQVNIKADLTAKLTTKHLILYAPELYSQGGEPSIAMEAQAKRILDGKALEWEARLGLKLRRVKLGVLDSTVVQEHIAHERHPLAEAPKENRLVLARGGDGRERLITDKSKGFRELEAVHRLTAGEDSDTIDAQFSAVLDGEIDLLDIRRIGALEARWADCVGRLDRFSRDIELHRRVWERVDRRLAQRRLFE